MDRVRAMEILRHAIYAYEFELEQYGYKSADELHSVVLNELSMTEREYLEIMTVPYRW